jgi:hypothetical protein
MAVRKFSSTRAVKIWLDVVLLLGALATIVLLIWAMAAPLVMNLAAPIPADVSALVAIGPHSAVPRLPLEFQEAGEAETPRFHRVRLMWSYGELRAETFDWRLHFVGLGFALVMMAAALWAIWNLRQVVKTALGGEPFAATNSSRLRRIGIIILAVTIIAPLIEYQVGRYLLEQLTIEGLTLSPALRFSKDSFLGGLLFLVLASIFRHGTALEEEKALTV